MISGRWGTPTRTLLDITAEPDGTVHGFANPGEQNAEITSGEFDATTGAVRLEGEHVPPGGTSMPFRIEGRLDGRVLRLTYVFGETHGTIDIVRVEDWKPPARTILSRVIPILAAVRRRINALSRPKGRDNARRLEARGESLDTIVCRDAVASDIPALAALHVETWNATYRTARGPSVATRTSQWEKVFAKQERRDFVLVLEDRSGRLIGFAWGIPDGGECAGQLSKIYLRWEYHGLGLGRRMMAESARRFLERGMDSFVLFAELSNPTLGFYDRLGGERLRNAHGGFDGAYAWRDARSLLGVK